MQRPCTRRSHLAPCYARGFFFVRSTRAVAAFVGAGRRYFFISVVSCEANYNFIRKRSIGCPRSMVQTSICLLMAARTSSDSDKVREIVCDRVWPSGPAPDIRVRRTAGGSSLIPRGPFRLTQQPANIFCGSPVRQSIAYHFPSHCWE